MAQLELRLSAGLWLSSIGGSYVIQHWDVAEEKNEAKAARAKDPKKVDFLESLLKDEIKAAAPAKPK